MGRMAGLANLSGWIIACYKSVPSIVVRAVLADVLSLFDLASDLYTIDSLFALGHNTTASALLTMVCLSFAAQVRAWMRCRSAYLDLSSPWRRGPQVRLSRQRKPKAGVVPP